MYNLDLRKMLHCHAKMKCVDEATYAHVIHKWVKDVRSRSVYTTSLCEKKTPREDGLILLKITYTCRNKAFFFPFFCPCFLTLSMHIYSLGGLCGGSQRVM